MCGVLTLVALLHVWLDLLHLQRHLVEAVLGPDVPRGLSEHLLGAEALLYDQVSRERRLVRGQTPDAEVVHLSDARHPEEGGLDQVVADPAGRGLHQDTDGVPQDRDGGGEHEDAEDEGADGVNDGVIRVEVNDEGSREHTCIKISWKLSSDMRCGC